MRAVNDQTHMPPGDLVVVGASAGGIEALSVLVGTLPPDFPAPVVLAQHLDPSRPSLLAEILERRTSLRIELVQSRSKLEPRPYLVLPASSACLAAALICAGVSKSGSPALKLQMSMPSAFIAFALAAIANVSEGAT